MENTEEKGHALFPSTLKEKRAMTAAEAKEKVAQAETAVETCEKKLAELKVIFESLTVEILNGHKTS